MKKRMLFVCSVCCCMAFSAYSQDRSTIHQAPAAVLENARLHALSDNINAKEAALLDLKTSSRGQMAAATEELNTLMKEYKQLLTLEIGRAATDEKRAQLKEELQYVESKQAVPTTR